MRRGVITLVAAIASFLGVIALLYETLPARGVAIGGASRIFADAVVVWEGRVHEAREQTDGPVIAMVGDSVTMTSREMRRAKKLALPERLAQHLATVEREPEVRIVPLRWGGLGPLEMFYLADKLAEAGADYVILSLNLQSLSPQWTYVMKARSALASWIAPARLPSALLLPLQAVGQSADKVLWLVALRAIGFDPPSRAIANLQSRAQLARERLGITIGHRGSSRQDPEAQRFYHTALFKAISGIRPSNPPLRLLVAAITTLEKAGTRVMVVAMPVNLDHWHEYGALPDTRGIGETVATVREEVTAVGADFADLHQLLPGRAFRDTIHLRFDEPDDGTQQAADALAPILAAALSEAGSR